MRSIQTAKQPLALQPLTHGCLHTKPPQEAKMGGSGIFVLFGSGVAQACGDPEENIAAWRAAAVGWTGSADFEGLSAATKPTIMKALRKSMTHRLRLIVSSFSWSEHGSIDMSLMSL
jgi:hypothetical protein